MSVLLKSHLMLDLEAYNWPSYSGSVSDVYAIGRDFFKSDYGSGSISTQREYSNVCEHDWYAHTNLGNVSNMVGAAARTNMGFDFDSIWNVKSSKYPYSTTNRDGNREYKSKGYICQNCSTKNLCTENSKNVKTVTKHLWSDYLETVEDIRHTPKYKELYERRKETIERVFADEKEKHAMRYIQYRGLSQVTNWVRLKFTAMNLKKFAIHRWKRLHSNGIYTCFYLLFRKSYFKSPNLA